MSHEFKYVRYHTRNISITTNGYTYIPIPYQFDKGLYHPGLLPSNSKYILQLTQLNLSLNHSEL